MSENTYVGTREVPWMKLGKLVDGVMTAEDAAHEGHLDFTVSLRDIQSQKLDGSWELAPDRKYVVRDDNDKRFEVVSKDYQILQFGEAFGFLNEVNPRFVAAASLKHGRQGFMAVQLPELTSLDVLGGEDPHEFYVIVRTSHDRSRAIEIALMPLRGKCMNQLTLASFTKGAKQRWSIRHAGNVELRMAEAKQILVNAQAYADAYVDQAARLDGIKLTQVDGEAILTHVIRKSPEQEKAISHVLAVWQNDPTVGHTDSAWGLVNAVSSYFDWERPGGNPESRFLGAIAGQTYNAINKTVSRVLTRYAG